MTRLFDFARVCALLLLVAATAVLADTYDAATLVRIRPADPEQLRIMREERVDVVGRMGDSFKALLEPEQLERLTAKGFEIEVLYAEMQADRERWAENDRAAATAAAAGPRTPNAPNAPTTYYTASKFNTTSPPAGSLMEHLLQQYNAHKTITRLYNLGASQDGAYDIIAMKISKNPDAVEAEPKIRIYGNIHGDEKGGCMVASDVLDTILSGYVATPQDPVAKRLVDETEMWFIPMGNPYGNAHNSRYNSRTVDLNRNFWGPAGSDEPPAWSEKETQAIRDLTEAATADHGKKRFATSISFHEGEIVFNSVWNYTTNPPSDEPIFWWSRRGGSGCTGQTVPNCPTLAPNGLAQAYKDGCTKPGFWYTEGYDWYGTNGDTNDWAYGAWTQLDTTVELNSTKSPAGSQIPTYTAQHRQAVLNYMMKTFQGIHGVMSDALTGVPIDGTVAVTATDSVNFSVPRSFQAIYTDPVAGDFHRVLQPGTYTMTCNATGYLPTVVTGLVVTADTKTLADCRMARTALSYASNTPTDSCAQGGPGNANAVLDAGEDATLLVTVSNPGTVGASAVSGSLSTTLSGVTITDGLAQFANVLPGGSASTVAPHFAFSVGPDVACGTVIPFSLHLTATQGAWDQSFNLTVGQPTPATPVTVFTESFDGTAFPPAGWTQLDVGGTTGNWARSTATVHPSGSAPHSGAGLAYFNGYAATRGDTTRLTRSAMIALPADAATAAASFWVYHDVVDASSDRVQLQVSTDGTTWTSVGTAVARNNGTTGWGQHTVSLSSYLGQSIEVAFLGIGGLGNDVHLDDVAVTYTPRGPCSMNACLAPQAPAEVAAAALAWSGRDTLTWPAAPNATTYHVYRGAPSDLPALLTAAADSCTAYAGAAPSFAATHVPDAGSIDWYLVTGLNGTLEGPAGNATAGARVVNSTGTCP